MSYDVPRGGCSARWWDRLYETDRLEYIDQPGQADKARRVLRGLDRMQRLTLGYRTYSRLVLAESAGLTEPRILELGAGRGRLARQLLKDHPAVRLTVSDACADSVEAFRAGALAGHPRVTSRVIDATSIDAPDDSWDVAVFAMSLHHLDPPQVRKALCEGTRVARRLLIIDVWRHPVLLAVAPLMFLTGGMTHVHDGVISLRKAYSASALHALAGDCGAPVTLRCRFCLPGYLVASAGRTTVANAAQEQGRPGATTGRPGECGPCGTHLH